MKAVQIHELGDFDVLQYEDVKQPEPGTGEVLVQVRAAGINPVDCAGRKFPLFGTISEHFPYILGWDISGQVVALGKGVTQFQPGDEVYGMPRFPGEAKGYSEYITAPVADLARKPQSLTHQEAATIPLAALTAWQALFDTSHLQAGQTVFISGGSGGVGHFAIQLAKSKGARVITTTSSRNVEFVRSLGADLVFDYTSQTFTESVQDVDVVLDTVGGDVLKDLFTVTRRGGSIVSIKGASGVREIGEQLAYRYGIEFTVILVHPSGTQVAELAKLADAGQLKPHLDTVFPLKEAAQAHRLSEGGHVRGKLVLTVS
jgi:NADPH:quinone reductase-like Zn-dependent oxidoreductase